MKKTLGIFLLLIMFVSAFAQTNEEEYYDPNYKQWANSLNDTTKTKQNIKFGISTGASVTGLNNGSAVNTWVAPNVLIPVNKRLSIETGLAYNQGFYNNYNPMYYYLGENPYGSINGNISTVSYYIKGNYKINENLTITGATYGSKVIRTTPVNPANPQAFNLDNNGYMVGFNYKFKNGSQLNFQLNLNQGNSPFYYTTPYNGMGFGASPRGNMFGTGFGM